MPRTIQTRTYPPTSYTLQAKLSSNLWLFLPISLSPVVQVLKVKQPSMEEIGSSSSLPSTHRTTTGPENQPIGSSKKPEKSTALGMKKYCLAIMVSVKEGFEYVKAFFVGQTKKLTARSEEEASEADLQASKMQVEAADAAEDAKTRLHKSS